MPLPRACLLLALVVTAGCGAAPAAPPRTLTATAIPDKPREPAKVRIRVTLDPKLEARAVSGRLFVLMSGAKAPADHLAADFSPFGPWIAAREIAHLEPGAAVTLDPDALAFPHPFSQAAPGAYQWMAILDLDHSFPYTWQNEGDLQSPVARAPIHAEGLTEIALTLDRRTPEAPTPADPTRKPFAIQSPLLTAFWGRPIMLRAVVALPPGYEDDPSRRYPGVYIVHGFGGSATRNAARDAPKLQKAMAEGTIGKQILVFLDGTLPSGHHEFADSVNNGPWGRALTEELIPALEKAYRLVPEPRARFVTGHSSGGWSSLWLLINYPDLFGGAWSTSPDPVDFRSFTGVDLSAGARSNVFRDAAGKPRNLFRAEGKDVMSFEDFTRLEQVQGDYGGQLASFEWVFSPRGPDGAPARIFDRVTGAVDPAVAAAWERYDIRRILEERWALLGPKLRGKLHLFVGAEDSFHLEEPLHLLCDFLAQKRSDAVCEFVPGRGHFNLYDKHPTYPGGLLVRILTETRKSFEATEKAR